MYANVLQICRQDTIDFAEVSFYFTVAFGDEIRAFALVFFYSPANEHLF